MLPQFRSEFFAELAQFRRHHERTVRLPQIVPEILRVVILARISHGDFLVETKFDDGPVFHRPWWSAIAGVRISGWVEPHDRLWRGGKRFLFPLILIAGMAPQIPWWKPRF